MAAESTGVMEKCCMNKDNYGEYEPPDGPLKKAMESSNVCKEAVVEGPVEIISEPNLAILGTNKPIPEPVYNWVDVTDSFTQKASQLKLGQLVHDNTFGLFEAMSAIEIMDPKMDAGMLCHKSRKVLPFDEAVETGLLKISGFTLPELIGIMDELVSCLVTWLDGHSLVQTVFICRFVHDPYILEDPCLKAFCIVILKLCDLIRNTVNKASVFEEEDFQTMSYGFKLGAQVSDTRAQGMLKEAEEEIAKKMKFLKSPERSRHGESDKELQACEAILSRLKLWRSLFGAFVVLEKPECAGLSTARQMFKTACNLLRSVTSTIGLGTTVEGKHSVDDIGMILGFDPLVNQRLLPPSFPRYTALFSREQAMQYIEGLINRLIHICSVVEISSFHLLLDFVHDFSKQLPCVLSRSHLQLMLWQRNNKVFGKLSLPEMLREVIRVFNSPPSIADKSSLSNNPQARELVEAFLTRAARSFTNVIRVYGHNRARQREKFVHLLEEFAALQDEADKTDAELHTMLTKVEAQRQHFACFGSWVLYHTLSIMTQFLLLGFELELYSPHEYHYIYWYLDFLYGWNITCLNRAEKLLQAQDLALEQKSGKSGKKSKKKKKASEKTIQEHQSMRSLHQGMRSLCYGYLKALEAFDMDDKLTRPAFEFDSEKIRFEHRFMPFQAIDTPQLVVYDQYREVTNASKQNSYKNTDLFLMSANYFQQARTILEIATYSVDEVPSLLKVAKTNLVVMKLAAGGHKMDSKSPPTFDFSHHPHFPIIQLN